MTLKLSGYIAVAPDVVAEVLCGPAYNEAAQRAREDNVSVAYTRVAEGPPLRYEVRVVSYKRKKTGAMDRSQTERSTVRYAYDPAARALTWRYLREEDAELIKIGGVTRLVPEGGGTRVEREVSIDIRIPVIGRGIAKLVAKGFEGGLKRSQALLDEMSRGASKI